MSNPLFSTYSQGENRVTSSILAVLERLSFALVEQILQALCQELMDNFRQHAKHLKRGNTGSYTIYARRAKVIIDEIDRILAKHYGFSEAELDFILNYDIKYRVGQ